MPGPNACPPYRLFERAIFILPDTFDQIDQQIYRCHDRQTHSTNKAKDRIRECPTPDPLR
jgi:hypothetical protein